MMRGADDFLTCDDEVAELAVLLPCRQVASLEQAAHEHGVTAAQMIRRLIQDFLEPDWRSEQGESADAVRQWA